MTGIGELEYLQRGEFDAAAVGDQLPAPLHLGSETSAAGARAFYDTFDWRLKRKGYRLAHEDGALRLFGSDGREAAAAPLKDAAEAVWPTDLPEGSLREQLTPLCDIRVLLRTAEIEGRRRVVPVLDDEEKTVARIVIEEATLRDGPSAGDALPGRVRVVGVRGYDKELSRLRGAIEQGLGLEPAIQPLEYEAAARAGAASPAGAQEQLTPDLPADRAAVQLCNRLLGVVEENLPGTLANLDSEFLHDFRVAIRRTRSLQRELKTVFPPGDLQHFRAEFRWLQQVTGPSRDLDVYLLEFDDFSAAVPPSHRNDLETLRTLLEERHLAERKLMEEALRSARTRTILDDWREFLTRLPARPTDDRPDGARPIADLAARRIDRVYRQMVKMGRVIDDDSPHEALHDLRKKGKELRYLLEFFAPLFPGKVTKPMVATLKSLQNTLGRFQDREIQATMLRGLAPDIARKPGGAQALMAMGILVERLQEQQDEARAEFHDRFEAFASGEQRALVKKTFA